MRRHQRHGMASCRQPRRQIERWARRAIVRRHPRLLVTHTIGTRRAQHFHQTGLPLGPIGRHRRQLRFGTGQHHHALPAIGQPRRRDQAHRQRIVSARDVSLHHRITIQHQRAGGAGRGLHQRDHARQPAAVSSSRVSFSGRPTTPEKLPERLRT